MSESTETWERLLEEKVRALADGRPAAVARGVSEASASPEVGEARRFLDFAFRRKEADVPSGSRFEWGKRLLLRASRIFLRSQTEYNAAIVETLDRVLRELESTRGDLLRATGRAEAAERRTEEADARSSEAAERARSSAAEAIEAGARATALAAEAAGSASRTAADVKDLAARAERLDAERRTAISGLEAALARESEARESLARALGREEAAREILQTALAREESARDRGDSAIEAARLALAERVDGIASQVGATGEAGVAGLRRELDRLRLAMAAFREPVVSGAVPGGEPQSGPALPVDDATYFEFEDEARGNESEIRERQRGYVGFLSRVSAELPGRPVLDLGCGRGELLGLLRDAGVPARGVDSNGPMVLRCREQGLDVVRGDLFAELSALADGSLAGITAAQVVEHLPVASIVRLLALARRKLAPGGALLLETINPESLYAMKFFWMDPTHVRPVPAPTLSALARGAGFSGIEVRMLSPVPGEVRPDPAGDERIARIDRAVFGDQDYVLFARVPA